MLDSRLRDVALSMMEALNCPRSVGVAILIRHNEWAQIASLATDPLHYSTADSYYRAVQASDFLRKVDDLDTGIDREANAIEKWEAAEFQCFETNRRLDPYVDSLLRETTTLSIENVILKARSLLAKWLGSLPEWLEPRFGPGATISDKSGVCTIPDKLTSVPTATPGAHFLHYLWQETAWGRAACKRGQVDFKSVKGNRFFMVPKDGKTRRCCAKGPSINVSYQLAVGRELRKRLRRAGIDLDTGQEVHRQYACSSSRIRDYASIDLSSASDCVSYNLVKLLIRPLWFDLLNGLREPYTLLPHKGKKWWRLEKFSAMGNGFTFELETLLFLALACSVIPGAIPGYNVLVYGDDILVPTENAKDVMACLRFFGFTPNDRKTYTTGVFRESCGGDFWAGIDVRPYQLKETPSEPHEWIALANGIYRALNKVYGGFSMTPWYKCLDQIPRMARLFGPERLGDLVLHSPSNLWTSHTRNSIRWIKTWSPARHRKVFWWGFSYDVQWASALYGVAWSANNHQDLRHLIPRDGVCGYAPKWVPCS